MRNKREMIITGLKLSFFILVIFGFSFCSANNVSAVEYCYAVSSDPKCAPTYDPWVPEFPIYPSGCVTPVDPSNPESYKSLCTNTPTINSFTYEPFLRTPLSPNPPGGIYRGIGMHFTWNVEDAQQQLVTVSCMDASKTPSLYTKEIEVCSSLSTTCKLRRYDPLALNCVWVGDVMSGGGMSCSYDLSLVPTLYSSGAGDTSFDYIVPSLYYGLFLFKLECSTGVTSSSSEKSYVYYNDLVDDAACCGAAEGQASMSKPSSNLCIPNFGTPLAVATDVQDKVTYWSWYCNLGNGTVSVTSPECTAPKDSSPPPPCTPNECAENICPDETCFDGCNTVPGTKKCFNIGGWKEVAP